MNFRLYRSRDRVVAGVAGGVADALDLDPSLVRIVWALAMFAGFPILVYIVMAIVVPEEPGDWEPWRPTTPAGPRTTPAGVIPATPDVPGSAPYSTTDASAAAADDATGTFATDASASPSTSGDIPPVAPAPGHNGWREARWAERQARREERWAERRERRAYRRDGTGAIVFGLILILVGAGFLAHQLVPSLDWDQIWPVGLVAIGVLLLIGSLTRRPAA